MIQYLYRKYGRDRAALAAAVTTYRPRSALRDTGKALGVEPAIFANPPLGLHKLAPGFLQNCSGRPRPGGEVLLRPG
ncbi:hypothetical protein CTP10_R66650 (plasmid) [Cupriavidus sp. P-10]|nr:hypothetical protein CTP10_R66650 [Cupriavidus sp. P-10]